jgi:DNA-binding NarL/FixJ family response regulator
VGSDTGSSRKADLAQALPRLRSTLARAKAELEMAEADETAPPTERLLEDVEEALGHLSAAEAAAQSEPRVLVVDDDARLAEITARNLRRRGFDADASGSLRLTMAGEVLVLDLGLLSGLDEAALDAVRGARPVVVTGATDRASRSLAERAGAIAYLVKPVDIDILVEAIRRRFAAG